MSTFTPEARSKGGRVAAERRRARAERSEAIDDAMAGYAEKFLGLVGQMLAGYAEKFLELVGQMLEQVGGEQYRCPCGLFGPKVPTVGLREAADVLEQLGAIILPARHEHEGLPPIQVNVVAGGPIVPYRPDEE